MTDLSFLTHIKDFFVGNTRTARGFSMLAIVIWILGYLLFFKDLKEYSTKEQIAFAAVPAILWMFVGLLFESLYLEPKKLKNKKVEKETAVKKRLEKIKLAKIGKEKKENDRKDKIFARLSPMEKDFLNSAFAEKRKVVAVITNPSFMRNKQDNRRYECLILLEDKNLVGHDADIREMGIIIGRRISILDWVWDKLPLK